MKELKEKQYEIDSNLQNHTSADENYYITASTVFNLAKNALKLFESSEIAERRALLNYLLQNLTARQKTLSFQLRSPFDVILDLTIEHLAPMIGRVQNFGLEQN